MASIYRRLATCPPRLCALLSSAVFEPSVKLSESGVEVIVLDPLSFLTSINVTYIVSRAVLTILNPFAINTDKVTKLNDSKQSQEINHPYRVTVVRHEDRIEITVTG
jgi:hypothetical protein